jgi:hypothetical protein
MGSILKSTDGVSKFEIPGEGVVVVTFDDKKTTVAKIVKALEKGSFKVKGKPVYVKPGAPLQQGSAQSTGTQPQEVPRYVITPDSSGTMSR